MALQSVVDMGQQTEVQLVTGQGAIGLPKEVRVVPDIADLSVLDRLLQVLSKVGVKRNRVWLKLGLDTNVAHLKIKLCVFFESDGQFVSG